MDRNRQRGMALLLLMLTLAVGAAGLLLSGYEPVRLANARQAIEAEVSLTQAAEAVTAYHLADNDNPGAVVCPDYHSGGDPGTHDVSCLTSGDEWFIGRLPWRTLDLPRKYGRLWYAIDADFRDDHNVSGGGTPPEPLNAGVDGSLSLDGDSGYAAIIFDPGEARAEQSGRPSYAVDDYLDGNNAMQDASDPTPAFVDCYQAPGCNDRARGVRADNLFAAVQLRVAGELEPLFEAYYINNGTLPRAAPLGTMDCDSNTFIGQVPTGQGNCNSGEYIDPDDLDSEDEWIVDNDWLDYIVYVVDEGCTASGSGCGNLRVNGVDGVHDLLIGAGPPLPSQEPRTADLEKYVDLAENTDGDNEYLNSPVTHENNDVIRWR